ncbi:hypothetical protein HA050_17925 [Iodobacter sp. HSC-16F04]|uniref:Chlor_Arch_YYY domain-containing protein n=1 Tax=Iodobacter violaceini TaxID=3044271 RepID=A0ABX0KVJ3_9NEIS|nr:DUF2298 domain-containing protein [Iodobacter violacea]NHQ87992.1 hypothetical protein [Iodobacter violacea]
MHLIYLMLTAAILLVNLAALGRLFSNYFADAQLARAAGTLTLLTGFFFIEHFIGLGRLSWIWPISTLLSVPLLFKHWKTGGWRDELPFWLPFAYVFAWRFVFPDIDGQSEHLTDLAFVSNYISGTKLPPVDVWLPAYRFDIYYGFLHYATALMGRVLALDAGRAMNFGFCLTIALTISLAWSITSHFIAERWKKGLLIAALLVGGTGVAPLLPVLFEPASNDQAAITQLWANTRFAGLYDQQINTAAGQALFPKTEGVTARELPLETLSYYIYLGDLHPPLAGFALLFFALALIIRLENEAKAKPLAFALGASVPLLLAVNAWNLPLQGLLVLGWCVYRRAGRQPYYLKYLIAGAVCAQGLLYPFINSYAPNALSAGFALVAAEDHTPLRQGLAIWWPVLLLAVLALSQGSKNQLAFWSGAGVLLLLALMEFVFIDDPLSGAYNRFNSTLKWWSWLYPAALILLGSITLSSPKRWQQYLAAIPLIAICAYALPQAQYWRYHPKTSAGQFAGDGWLKNDFAHRAILNHLRTAEKGVVLEGLDAGSYTPASAFALHSGHPAALGWPDHESLWRNQAPFIQAEAGKIRAFYHASLPNAEAWLNSQNIRYIVWSRFDQTRGPAAFSQLKAQLEPHYAWRALVIENGVEFGVWERRF